MNKKKFSFVLAARNDTYMGNSNWRLEITLNFLTEQVKALQQLLNVEIIVVDWGSSQPLHDVINLSDSARSIVRYIKVPKDIHEEVCRGSTFPVPIALNVGIRRAAGEFIALTSGDVLWTSDVIASFIQVDANDIPRREKLNRSMIFIPRKNIPWSFVSQNPGIKEIDRYFLINGNVLEVEPLIPFYLGCAGALVMHRDLWIECRGNDEKLVFWGFNDIDLSLRMQLKYPCIDYYQTYHLSVYHLEHYPSRTDSDLMPKKLNPHVFNPFTVNDENWGLAQYSFAECPPLQDSSAIISSVSKIDSSKMHFRLRHLTNILSFMFSGYTKKHLIWSLLILKDYFLDLLPSRTN